MAVTEHPIVALNKSLVESSGVYNTAFYYLRLILLL